MLFSDLLTPERVYSNVRASSKKRLLELISSALVKNDPGLDSREVFESLCARERLGSTGLGNGVAIPHGRISGESTVQAVFIRLAKPLDYGSADGKPVDLLFALVVPEHSTSDHLRLLSQIAEQFSDEALLKQLREADDNTEMLDRLSGNQH